MSEHNEYTIAGTTYYAVDSALFVESDETHDYTEVDDHPYHLFDGRPCRMGWGGDVFSSVKITPFGWDVDATWRHVRTENFEPVTALEAVTPDGVNECPDCGRWAGSSDEEPRCIHCGYGYDDSADTDGVEQ